jgi:hypothetical protein
MLRYDAVLVLLALVPLIIAVIYRLAIVPRRTTNTRDLLRLSLGTLERAEPGKEGLS